MPETPTKQAALDTLLTLLRESSPISEDAIAAEAFNSDLITKIFNHAWRYQFDDDSSPFENAVSDEVVEAVDGIIRSESR